MAMPTNGQGGRLRRGYQPMADINVTPMIDVMLVLLIVFMITSPMLVTGVNVDLPESGAKPVKGSDAPLAVSVDARGRIYIQDTRIKKSDLTSKLLAITKENKNIRIFVRGDKNIDYGVVMKVVGDINKAGFTKVALITEVEN